MCCQSYQMLAKVTAPPSSKLWLQGISADMHIDARAQKGANAEAAWTQGNAKLT